MFTLILIIVFFAALYLYVHRHEARKRQRNRMTESSDLPIVKGWCLFLVIVWLVVAVIATGSVIFMNSKVNNSSYVVAELTMQRNALAGEFEEILDSSEYAELIAAAHPDDIKFLRTNPEVTGFLLGRADRIVSINEQLFAERNELLEEARSACNVINNPMIPQFPFMAECKLDSLENLWTFDS